jgi:hypothetical protein
MVPLEEDGLIPVRDTIDCSEQGSGIDRVIINNVLIDFLNLY